MRRNEGNETEIVIDVKRILLALLKYAWAIIVAGVIVAFAVFTYNSRYVTPKYSSSVMLYVNNKSFSVGDSFSISAADLSASQSLIDTYIVILKNRTTMEEIIERAEVDYSAGELKSMISTSKIDGTEVFTVTVTSEDPYEAAHIANCISDVLPHRIEEIVDGSSMRIVDTAVVNLNKISPNITKQTVTAFIGTVFAVAALVAVLSFFDDTIRSEQNLADNFNLPILSRIPDLKMGGSHGKRGYGYYKRGYGYYKRHRNSYQSYDKEGRDE